MAPSILPASLRRDPQALVPAALADRELHRGLLYLVANRLLPQGADLTPALVGGGTRGAPLQAGGCELHEYERQFVRPPPTTALEDSLLAASGLSYKLDLLTPADPPSPAASSTLRLMPPGSPSQGQQQRQQQLLQQNPSLSLVVKSQEYTNRWSHQHEGDSSGDTQQGGRGSPPTAGFEVPQPARPFEALMDSFSLHELMIRMGKTLTSTPEFQSYSRSYEPLWEPIEVLLTQLEGIMARYAVPLAIVDGKSLADLARGVLETERSPQVQDLLLCVRNIQEVGALLRQPGRRFLGLQGKASAAAVIQARWRGIVARRKYSRHGVAAATIQGAWRSHRLKQSLRERLHEARAQRDDKFKALHVRMAQQWPLMQRHPHVVVHLPNSHRGRRMPTSMAQGEALLAAESAQLARLCDLSNPLVEVLLLLPRPPDPDVQSYWEKILQVGGIERPSARYRLIWPENHARLPSHLSLSAKLLGSPSAMKRIKAAVAGRLAYVVPGSVVSDEEVDLCVQLNAPLLGPSSAAATALSRKTGARALLASAGVLVPAGVAIPSRRVVDTVEAARKVAADEDGVVPLRANTEFAFSPEGEVVIVKPKALDSAPNRSQTEEEELRVLLKAAEAMVRNPRVARWLLKVDDEVMGCGTASFETKSIKGAPEVLERLIWEHQQNHKHALVSLSSDIPPLTEPEQVAQYRLNELLFRQLPRQLGLPSSKEACYPTYRDFIAALAERGGSMEACPEGLITGSPRADLFVAPGSGKVEVLATHERVFVAPFRAVGSSFPQLSAPHAAVAAASMNVGASCFRAGIVGYVSVDFVTSRADRGSGALRVWAVDLSTSLTPTLLSFQLFHFLSAGEWNPEAGTYRVSNSNDHEDEEGQGGGKEGATLLSVGLLEGAGGRESGRQIVDHFPKPIHNEDWDNRPSTAEGGAPSPLQHKGEPRYYFCLDAITHAGVAAGPCAKFFQRCRQEGLYFDVDASVGVILNLCEKYISGVMGAITVGPSPARTYEDMLRLLAFVSLREREVVELTAGHPSAHRHVGSGSALSLGAKLAPFKDIHLLVKFMAEVSSRR